MGDGDNGGDYGCVGRAGTWGISVPSSLFCYEPITTLKKIKSLKKEQILINKLETIHLLENK